MTVYASSTSSGNSTLENLTTGQTSSMQFSNQQYLCNTDAEWIVEDFGEDNGGHVPLTDFERIILYNTQADSSNSGTTNTNGARIVNLGIDGRTRSRCGSNFNDVQCDYVS